MRDDEKPGAEPPDDGGTPPPKNPFTEKFPKENWPPTPVEPAVFPKGFWRQVDYLLHNPEAVLESLRRGENLSEISRIAFTVTAVMAAIYGAVMGSSNLLQGSPMAMQYKFAMMGVTAIKVPVLFLMTLLIVFPPVYVSNAFAGARYPFAGMLTMLLATVAITSTMLASMATVALFFALTSRSYHFIILLHVLFFSYAGIIGVNFLYKSARRAPSSRFNRTPSHLFVLWLVLYMFVGTQLAWVLRPYVGSPSGNFEIFRARSGNFYESVAQSLKRVTSGEKPKR